MKEQTFTITANKGKEQVIICGIKASRIAAYKKKYSKEGFENFKTV